VIYKYSKNIVSFPGHSGLIGDDAMQPQTLPDTGFVRLPQVLAVIPVSKSSWWEGVKAGKYPQPIKLGPNTTAWKVSDIRALIEQIGEGE
jgi:prophage regulatory protein